ncbi:hypothetical protein H5410_037372 [Solanum commersonii]|uniref:Uncharacterized protein n=1 Tax=Solanum commersonii TaxID=4109 RepID=A0A9J5YA13_SOLCO|nr:hypothetical protein H5410_037372 [Solanum commersonii]
MFLGMMQIVTAHKWYLYPPIILATPFINAIYPFTNINAKGFSATYKNQDISYSFITEPISRDINALIEMKQKHFDYLQLEIFSMNIFDTLKSAKVQEKIKLISEKMVIDICVDHPSAFWNRKKHNARGKDSYTRGRGRSSPSSSRSSYGSSSSSTPIIQKGGMKKSSSSIHLEDIPESDPLYVKLQEFITQKQGDSFASIAKKEVDDIKTYEKVEKREMIFLLENSDIQRREEPWKIFQRYLVNGLYFPGESYKTRKYYETLLISTGVEFQHFSGYNTSENVYNFSKIIIKHAFNKVLCYNNERHKHTWFLKVCAKIFANPIPNWFLNWWSYHEPTIKILSEPFLKLYKEWVKVSPDLNKLYHQEHICYFQQIEHIYFFIEFSVPWIHKWVPKVDFTEEQIPCLYRTYYNNF